MTFELHVPVLPSSPRSTGQIITYKIVSADATSIEEECEEDK